MAASGVGSGRFQKEEQVGVRMALCAEARHVQRRVVESLLFGVESADVGTFLSMSAALVLVGLLASYLPAWRGADLPTHSV